MTKVNHCVKSNLSGRRVVVSISSTSDKSCLWKPGFIILFKSHGFPVFRRKKTCWGKPAHHRDVDSIEKWTRLLPSPPRHRLSLAPCLLKTRMGSVRISGRLPRSRLWSGLSTWTRSSGRSRESSPTIPSSEPQQLFQISITSPKRSDLKTNCIQWCFLPIERGQSTLRSDLTLWKVKHMFNSALFKNLWFFVKLTNNGNIV